MIGLKKEAICVSFMTYNLQHQVIHGLIDQSNVDAHGAMPCKAA